MSCRKKTIKNRLASSRNTHFKLVGQEKFIILTFHFASKPRLHSHFQTTICPVKMGVSLIFIVILSISFVCYISALSTANCPASTRLDICNPQCKDNSNCRGSQICCTNICGTKTCTEVNVYQKDNQKYKGGSGGGSSSKGGNGGGVYCGNTKCDPREKCEFDRSTKREKCVRT